MRSTMRLLGPCLALLVLLAGGCPGAGSGPGSGGAGGASGGTFTLDAGGKKYTFRKASLEFDKGIFDGGRHELTLYSHDPQTNACVIDLRTHTGSIDKLAGERIDDPDYSSDNPKREYVGVDACLNRFEPADGMHYYQGHRMVGTVRAVNGNMITLEIDSTFLRFQGQDEEALIGQIGEEVRVTGTVTLPVDDLTSKRDE